MKAAILILSVILSITVKVHGLQCYVCYDCTKATDDSLITCEDYSSNSTTTNSTTTTSSTTESATNSSSTTTSTTTPSTTTTTNTTSSTTTPTNTTSSTTTPNTTETDTTATGTDATDTTDTTVANMIYISVERADSYECISGTINVSNTTVTVRGCAINPTNNTCTASSLSDCTLCSTDKCNGATAVHSSAALLCLLFLALLCKE